MIFPAVIIMPIIKTSIIFLIGQIGFGKSVLLLVTEDIHFTWNSVDTGFHDIDNTYRVNCIRNLSKSCKKCLSPRYR